MRKNVRAVVNAFDANIDFGKRGDSIWTDGDSIFSYNTCILTTAKGDMVFNDSRYSVTTSIQQGALKANYQPKHVVTGLPHGATPDDLYAVSEV